MYRINTEESIKQIVNGQTIPVNTTVEMLLEMNVKEKSEQEIKVDFFYKEIVFDYSNPIMNRIKYDSKNSVKCSSIQERVMTDFLNSLIGKSMNVIFKPDGSIKSISGFNSILKDIQKNTASNNPGIQQMVIGFLRLFDEDAMKRIFIQTFQIYPDKEVNVGESWNNNVAFTADDMYNEINNTYTLKSVNNDSAVVETVAAVDIKPGSCLGGEMTGDKRGKINLNIKTGLPLNFIAIQNTKGKFNAQGTEILMEVTSKMSICLLQ